MNRFARHLVPLFLPACMIDTPVVDGPDAGDGSDRLGANLGAWCDSWCARMDVCGAGGDECVAECVETFRDGFANKNDTCTAAGLRVMDCLEQAPCAELASFDACAIQEERALCAQPRALVNCRVGDGGEPASMDGEPASGFSCSAGFEECSNGSVYRLACDGPGDPPECSCMVDDEVVGRFIPSRLRCPGALEVARICGWPVTDGSALPTYPPVWYCHATSMSGLSGGVPTGDCTASFMNCSNGHSYEIECRDTAPGVVDCTCLVNGEEYDTYQSEKGVCPFAFDLNDGATVATNYACGFNLSSVPVPK
ncbi:MAG TPA: hypothetical protein VFZ53_08480 [Polyangiaceae bacterium]